MGENPSRYRFGAVIPYVCVWGGGGVELSLVKGGGGGGALEGRRGGDS